VKRLTNSPIHIIAKAAHRHHGKASVSFDLELNVVQLDQFPSAIPLNGDALVAQILTASTLPDQGNHGQQGLDQSGCLRPATSAEANRINWAASSRSVITFPDARDGRNPAGRTQHGKTHSFQVQLRGERQ
jgi:hypothetical protein